ncbi:NADAR family protein [Marinobacter flavimaris]|uniref:NADAR family protein n=1 Tax=Marinobacter flavimaris TaxID=262076 RepID=A0A3D8H2K2_9GAMM|nr:NADAR family protein [Marinobacter flavimaris]PPI80476.1 DUF1768 domain-containing protein [Marinobacter flavimaris]RDU40915.1 NADAR family protein [Marinobacter flavimaris]
MVPDRSKHLRIYQRESCVVFLKTNETFGGLSNMAGGYPVKVNGMHIRSSESLYQACRFPHLPQAQKLILEQSSPMTAKMKSKRFRKDSRPDWENIRVTVMRWCLRVKLAYNPDSFGKLLLATEKKPIVEESRKDSFWGANPETDRTLIGYNVLGRLLMELREELRERPNGDFTMINPPDIESFLLCGRPIEPIFARRDNGKSPSGEAKEPPQGDLF